VSVIDPSVAVNAEMAS